MYTRLTKIITVDGKECVACAAYGTGRCQIHNDKGNYSCANCSMFAAVLNQLNAFEEAYCSKDE